MRSPRRGRVRREEGGAGHAARAALAGAKQGGLEDVRCCHGAGAGSRSRAFLAYAIVVYMLVGAVEVLYTATVTAYYFDCKRTEEEKAAGHIHME